MGVKTKTFRCDEEVLDRLCNYQMKLASIGKLDTFSALVREGLELVMAQPVRRINVRRCLLADAPAGKRKCLNCGLIGNPDDKALCRVDNKAVTL